MTEKEPAKNAVTKRLEIFVEKCGNIELDDFDFRVRRFLYSIYNKHGKLRLEEGLNMLAQFTSQKLRSDVKNWPAYLITLLKKFEPELFPVPQSKGHLSGSAKNNRRDKLSSAQRERGDSKDSVVSKTSKDINTTSSLAGASLAYSRDNATVQAEMISVADAIDMKSECEA